jgi:hypothetical protein
VTAGTGRRNANPKCPITPPIGINVFVLHGMARYVPLGTIFRGITPFLIGDLTRLALRLPTLVDAARSPCAAFFAYRTLPVQPNSAASSA